MSKIRTWLSIPKVRVLIFTGLALIALVLLSSGLANLHLAPGQPFPVLGDTSKAESGVTPPGDEGLMVLLRIIYYIGLFLLPFFIIYILLNPQTRKQLLKDLVKLAVLLLIAYFAFERLQQNVKKQEVLSQESGKAPVLPTVTSGESAHFMANPSNWAVTIAGIVLALLVGLIAAGVLWFLLLHRKQPETPYQQIAEEAQDAMDAILSGGDFKEIIIRCYIEMGRLVSVKRGLSREKYMTPHEFELAMTGKGLPRLPIHQLTSVFEMVRYSQHTPGKKDELRALDSLGAIVEACKETA